MAWVRLDDQFPDHPKVLGLSDQAFRLHVTALCYCSAQLTDGRVTALLTRRLTWFVTDSNAVTNELVTSGLWEQDGEDFIIHDYLEYNPSAKQVKAARKANADRQKRHRTHSNGGSNALRNALVTAPPSPSPSPSEERGVMRPPASSSAPVFPEQDPEWGAAISKLEAIGPMTGSILLELLALWPDLVNGKRAWLDDCISVAKANGAGSPAYAVRVLTNSVRSGKRPGEVAAPSSRRKSSGVTSRDLDEILGVDIHGNPVNH